MAPSRRHVEKRRIFRVKRVQQSTAHIFTVLARSWVSPSMTGYQVVHYETLIKTLASTPY